MILYRITKERAAKHYAGGFRIDKHEVVITASNARAMQCVAAAKRENKYYRAEGTSPYNYKYTCACGFIKEREWRITASYGEILRKLTDD